MTTRRTLVERENLPALFSRPSLWTTSDDVTQELRFTQLAWGTVTIQQPGVDEPTEMGPFLREGDDAYCLLLLRCPNCRAELGSVWAVNRWYEQVPFMWTEMARVLDADARPPTVSVTRMVLDRYTAAVDVRGQCVRHGWSAAPVAMIRGCLPDAADRWRPDRRPTSLSLIGES